MYDTSAMPVFRSSSPPGKKVGAAFLSQNSCGGVSCMYQNNVADLLLRAHTTD